LSEQERIKFKIKSIDSKRWWGDNFDVRFFLVSQLKFIVKKNILDVGGGIGIISSELDNSNLRINLDSSFDDLRKCLNNNDSKIQCVCASMTNLPFKKEFFDYVICANILEVAKSIDLEYDQKRIEYPTVNKTLEEIKRILKISGIVFLTTPNNSYYKSIKLTFAELKSSISIFNDSKIYFYNTHIKISKNRKLNMANIIPKLKSKFINSDKIIQNLVKENTKNNYSVSFFVKAIKN
jgi:2-polyprenyl-3-methyl-5-hydroxy-6-metoxy-1,4-benzoquinol methylase